MKYKAQFKKDVREVCKKLRWEFYVNEWTMDIVWYTENDDKDESKQTAASIPINGRYLTYKVNIYPVLQDIWKDDKDKFVEILVHEYSHLLTEPLYDVAVNAISNREAEHLEDIRERQTQRICNLLFPFLKTKIIKTYKNAKPSNKSRRTRRTKRD